jgi:hypothetical protein
MNEITPITESFADRVDRERRELQDALHHLYYGVVGKLDGWEVWENLEEEPHHSYRFRVIQASDVKTFKPHAGFMSWDMVPRKVGNKQVIHVSGNWPRGISPHQLHPNVEAPSINISADKTHEQMAKDITRRFLPEYQRIYGLCADRVQADQVYANSIDGVLKSLIAIDPDKIQPGHRESSATFRYDSIPGGGYGGFTVNSPTSVTLTLNSLDVKTAQAVIRALITK